MDMVTGGLRNKKVTGPSYQNESSDSASRKPLDEFQNALNTKQILRFDGVIVHQFVEIHKLQHTFD